MYYPNLNMNNLDNNNHENMIQLVKEYVEIKNYNLAIKYCRLLINALNINGHYMLIRIMLHLKHDYSDILTSINHNQLMAGEFDPCLIIKINYVIDFLNEPIRQPINNTNRVYHYSYENNKIIKYKLPFNFSWVIPDVIAGMSLPSELDLTILAKLNIKHIITCLEKPLSFKNCPSSIQIHHFAIDDTKPPTLEQIEEILVIAKEGHVLVHCKGGIGRTNTVIACYLIKHNLCLQQNVVKYLEDRRPTCKLTQCQKDFIKMFTSQCFNTQLVTYNNLTVLPKIIMCVGYPASGKSTFCQQLIDAYGDNVVRINQDDYGRSICYDIFNDNIHNKKTILIDFCNLTKEKRDEWNKLSFEAKTWCIFFDIEITECLYRITRRQNHATSGCGEKILASVKNKLEIPSLSESKAYDKLYHIKSEDDATNLLSKFGIECIPKETSFVKFPRTKHLLNLGSASRDDLIFSQEELSDFLQNELSIEEKIDGSNMGISVDSHGKLCVQNRSHYIDSTYHPQYKLLDKWIFKHSDELHNILDTEDNILFGEWLYMKHSINYDALSDLFICYDLYNKINKTFLSREELENKLKNTSIKQVPLIIKKKFTNIKEISDLLKTKSKFYDGLLEGLYVRNSIEGKTESRGKLVRSDFICGDPNYNKNKITLNGCY